MSEAIDDEETRTAAERRRLAAGCRAAARRAIAFARRYRDEEGAPGARERECVAQALVWRASARDLLLGKIRGPGLVRAVAQADAARRAG